MNSGGDQIVKGRIVFGEDALPFQGASVEVVVEDTTYADAPALRLRSVKLDEASFSGSPGASIAFRVDRPPLVTGRRQTLRVMVDVDRDGRLGSGDYHNAEGVVLLPDTTSTCVVRVRRVP